MTRLLRFGVNRSQRWSEDNSCSSPDLSPASLFLPPDFNKTPYYFRSALFFPVLFSPPCFSSCTAAWFCQARDMQWHQNPESGSMGIFQHCDNRMAALTGAIELIRRPSSDNVITAVLRPLIPLPTCSVCIRSRRWEEEGGGHSFNKGLTQ